MQSLKDFRSSLKIEENIYNKYQENRELFNKQMKKIETQND